ncbi:M3 family metallopeptidase [Candidatus Dependentiae bacterium]
MLSKIRNKKDIEKLFPKTPAQIESLVNKYIQEAQEKIDQIISIKSQEKTFANTAKALDELSSLDNISVLCNALAALEMLSPEKSIRDTTHKELIKIQKFWIDQVSNNQKLYKALKDYAEHNANKEDLTQEEHYFLTETISDYKRAGLDLPEEQLNQVKKLNKELGELELQFDTNIAQDKTNILVSQEELAGTSKEFIDSLEKDVSGNFIVSLDYPTYANIMDNCCVQNTRKKLYLAFTNRAYPQNKDILERIREKRHQLAQILGFESYAHLDLDDQMAKNPQTVQIFLDSLYKRASNKAQKEFEQLTKKLPESVILTKDGCVNPWDTRYIKNYYKKKNLNLNEQEISQYFPTEKTIKNLLEIYEQFFGLQFNFLDTSGADTSGTNYSSTPLWHKDVKLIEVYAKSKLDDTPKILLGYLLLDLHPRENKYSHACQITIVPAVKNKGMDPCVEIVVANFPKTTAHKPSLLKREDVETFFHELGHALHAILGRTSIGSFSGTSVKTDFVEMPSQMLEEWLSDKDIVKKISSHYKTGEPLPDKQIENILALKHFDTGDFLQRQCYLSCLALSYFNAKEKGNAQEIYQALTKKMRPRIAYEPQDNMYASFGHLSGYGAKYYSYMWSKVFAIEMFCKIKNYGLLNPIIGQKYIDQLISRGGSQDPNILLKNFLGKEPDQDSFFAYLGLQ